MKILMILLSTIFCNLSLGAGTGQIIQQDLIRFGIGTSTDTKQIEFNTGDSPNNIIISVDDAQDMSINIDKLTVRDGTDGDFEIVIDRAANDPYIKYDQTEGKWKFNNDGLSEKAFGSGSGGGGGGINLFVSREANGDFEDTTGTLTGWSATGSSVLTIDDSGNQLDGTQSANWDATANGEQLNSTALQIQRAFIGQNCSVDFYYVFPGNLTDLDVVVLDTGVEIVRRDLVPTPAGQTLQFKENFTCPDTATDTLQLRIEASADSVALQIDNNFLGTGKNLSFIASDYEYLGPLTTDGSWTTNTTYAGNFWRNGDRLLGEVLVSLSGAPNSALLSINLPSGYTVDTTKLNDGAQVVGNLGPVSLRDAGTRTFPGFTSRNGTTSVFAYVYEDTGTFEQFSAISETNPITFGASDEVKVRFEVPVTQFGTKVVNQSFLTFDTSAWHVDASIGGGNFPLSTGTISTFSATLQASADMVINTAKGSQLAEIPCNGGNESDGLTCGAGVETLGISAVLPTSGRYEVCFDVSLFQEISVNSTTRTTFRIDHTANDLSSILQAGVARPQSALDWNFATNNIDTTTPVNICESFFVSTAGKATFILKYVHLSVGTVVANDILADRAAGSSGDRDVHVTIEKMDEQKPAPVFTDIKEKISTQAGDNYRLESAFLNCRAASVINSQRGNWIQSIGNVASGACVISFQPGIFSSAPDCFVQRRNGFTTFLWQTVPSGASSSGVTIDCLREGNVDCTDYDYDLLCFGPK